MVSQGFKQFFNEALTELKLEAPSFSSRSPNINSDRNLELRVKGTY